MYSGGRTNYGGCTYYVGVYLSTVYICSSTHSCVLLSSMYMYNKCVHVYKSLELSGVESKARVRLLSRHRATHLSKLVIWGVLLEEFYYFWDLYSNKYTKVQCKYIVSSIPVLLYLTQCV